MINSSIALLVGVVVDSIKFELFFPWFNFNSCIMSVILCVLPDVDECSSNSTNSCQFACINTLGGYRCECPVGYHLGADGKKCQGKEFLLF